MHRDHEAAIPFWVFLTLDKFLSLPPSNSPNGCLVIFECGEMVAIIIVEQADSKGVVIRNGAQAP